LKANFSFSLVHNSKQATAAASTVERTNKNANNKKIILAFASIHHSASSRCDCFPLASFPSSCYHCIVFIIIPMMNEEKANDKRSLIPEVMSHYSSYVTRTLSCFCCCKPLRVERGGGVQRGRIDKLVMAPLGHDDDDDDDIEKWTRGSSFALISISWNIKVTAENINYPKN